MSLENNLIINLYSIIILLVILLQRVKNENKELLSNKVFLLMLKTVMVLLILDIFSRFDGQENLIYPLLNQVGNFLVFGLSLVVPSLFLIYTHSQIFPKGEKTRKLYIPLIALNLLNFLFTIISLFFGNYYYIDQSNIYHRGPCFFIPVILTFILLLLNYVFIIANKNKFEKKYYFTLLFFAIPPTLSVILQVSFYGISLMLNSVVISLLIVFLNIQNQSMSTDYLTGINNRKSLESYLDRKINSITPEKTFSAIIIDLDDFKKINDNYGHNEGDKALQVTAKILSGCLRLNDFIARFGGDEFFIVLDTSKQEDLEDIVSRIKLRTEKYNETSGKKYKVSFSMGYAVYDYDRKMDAGEFQKYVDLLMYKEKSFKDFSQLHSKILNGL